MGRRAVLVYCFIVEANTKGSAMRSILIAALLLFSAAGNAATVVIDFEEFSVGESAPLVSKGFIFSGYGVDPESGFGCCDAWIGDDGGSKALTAYTSSETPFNPPAELSFLMQRQDGDAFALYSMDIGAPFMIVAERASDGTTISGYSSELGSGDWLDIKWAGFSVFAEGPYAGGYQIDNIVVGPAAVPIPAAVWLFGSALAGLGWLRRKQSV
jgi:hypothetical protein